MMDKLEDMSIALNDMYDARSRLIDYVVRGETDDIPELVSKFQLAAIRYGRVTV
jgi:hypothetical protein